MFYVHAVSDGDCRSAAVFLVLTFSSLYFVKIWVGLWDGLATNSTEKINFWSILFHNTPIYERNYDTPHPKWKQRSRSS